MTRKDDFSADEWGLLQKVLVGASTAAMHAQEGGEQREIGAIHSALTRASGQFSGNELLRDLVASVADDSRSLNDAIRSAGKQSFTNQRAALIDQAGQAAALLARKGTPEDAEGFQRLLSGVVDTVINAAGEGGSMGFSGARVSAEEETLLADLKAALAPPQDEAGSGNYRAVSE